MDTRKERYEFIRNCIRELKNRGLIKNLVMIKEEARPVYNALKRDYAEKVGFSSFLADVKYLQIVISGKSDRITFDAELFDAIIQNTDKLILKPFSTTVVSQLPELQENAQRNAEQLEHMEIPNINSVRNDVISNGHAPNSNQQRNTVQTKNIHHTGNDKPNDDLDVPSTAATKSANIVSLDIETPDYKEELKYVRKLGQYKLPTELRDVFDLNTVDPANPLTVENYTELLHLLLYMEEQQMVDDIKEYNGMRELVPVHGSRNYFELHDLELSEHRPSLIVGDVVNVQDMDSMAVFRAVVCEKYETSVCLQFQSSFAGKFVRGKEFFVSFNINRTTLREEHQAVSFVKEHGVAKYFFPRHIIPQQHENISINYYNDNIRSDIRQQQAISHILSRTSYPAPYLIYGPPGTGKTVTLVETVLQIVKLQPGKNILVCAPSNSAANVIANRLCRILKKSQMLRFVSFSFPFSEIPKDVRPYCNYGRNRDYYSPSIGDITKYTVIVSTLTNAGRFYNAGLSSDHFSYVFVDECGYATETETLIALAGIATSDNSLNAQVVLIGDPMQLGPVVHSATAKRYGFDVSMLERLMYKVDIYKKHDNIFDDNYITKLLTNYRSHEELMKISNEAFYDNELTCNCDHLALMAIGHDVLKNKNFPMLFHSVCGTERSEKDSPSLFNLEEVEIVLQYLRRLIGTRMKGMLIKPSHVGVISPYRKQEQKIKNRCMELDWDGIMTGSVEKFQGTERLITVISTVRSKEDQRCTFDFVRNPKRFNVAVTRAKALIIVVGNAELLQRDKLWATYIGRCKENGNFEVTLKELSNNTECNVILNPSECGMADDVDFSRGNL